MRENYNYVMETKDHEYLDAFGQRVSKALVESCTADGLLEGQMLEVEELDEKWRTSAPEYMAAAVPQIADYPMAAVAWACYLGMGAAVLWDKSWGEYKDVDDWYKLIASPRGFDCMDEYVTECLLGCKLDGEDATKIEESVRRAAQTALSMIRKEQIEPQSAMAFHVFARTTKEFFRLGVSIALRRLGYHYVKVRINGAAPES